MNRKYKKYCMVCIIGILFFVNGCATIITVSMAENETQCSTDSTIPRIYSGTVLDLYGLTAENIGFFALIDLPLSCAADTMILPYSVYAQKKYGHLFARKNQCNETE